MITLFGNELIIEEIISQKLRIFSLRFLSKKKYLQDYDRDNLIRSFLFLKIFDSILKEDRSKRIFIY